METDSYKKTGFNLCTFILCELFWNSTVDEVFILHFSAANVSAEKKKVHLFLNIRVTEKDGN